MGFDDTKQIGKTNTRSSIYLLGISPRTKRYDFYSINHPNDAFAKKDLICDQVLQVLNRAEKRER
jgi:hypothetical protein